MIFMSGLYYACSDFLPYMGIMAVLWLGGTMILNESPEVTLGELTSFIIYCKSMAGFSSAIANSYTSIINGTYAIQKVF